MGGGGGPPPTKKKKTGSNELRPNLFIERCPKIVETRTRALVTVGQSTDYEHVVNKTDSIVSSKDDTALACGKGIGVGW